MTAMEDAVIIEEIKQLLERLVIPRLEVIAKQLEDLRKQSDSMKSGISGAGRGGEPPRGVNLGGF